jgi:hypothetical protein
MPTCLNNAEARIFNDSPLMVAKWVKRPELADKVEKREITQAAAEAQFASAMAQLQMQAAQMQAQQQTAAAADFGNRLERAGAYL